MARFKYLIAIFLIIASPCAIAEWTLIGTSINYDMYADKATIRKNGNITRMWVLYDFRSPRKLNAGTYLSSVNYREHDCVEEKSNLLSATTYSKNMRMGDVVYNYNYDEKSWDYIMPDSMSETEWKIACGR